MDLGFESLDFNKFCITRSPCSFKSLIQVQGTTMPNKDTETMRKLSFSFSYTSYTSFRHFVIIYFYTKHKKQLMANTTDV